MSVGDWVAKAWVKDAVSLNEASWDPLGEAVMDVRGTPCSWTNILFWSQEISNTIIVYVFYMIYIHASKKAKKHGEKKPR